MVKLGEAGGVRDATHSWGAVRITELPGRIDGANEKVGLGIEGRGGGEKSDRVRLGLKHGPH